MNILLSGYYGYGNLGDEALLAGLLTPLRQAGHDVTLLSGNPEETLRLHQEMTSDGTLHATSRYWGALPALLRCDAFISGGGGLLQDKTSRRSLQYYLLLIRLAKLFRKKVVVYGQSIGPLSDEGRQQVARALRGVSVAVRDETSRQLVASLGIEAQRVADPALLLEPPLTPAPADAPILFIPRGGYPDITATLAKLADALRQDGNDLAVLALDPERDQEAVDALRAAVPDMSEQHADTPQQALATIGRSCHVVSARLHGLILGAVAERPVTGLVYDPKVAAFLGALGRPAYEAPFDLGALLRDVRVSEPLDSHALTTLHRQAEDGIDWLLRTLV